MFVGSPVPPAVAVLIRLPCYGALLGMVSHPNPTADEHVSSLGLLRIVPLLPSVYISFGTQMYTFMLGIDLGLKL